MESLIESIGWIGAVLLATCGLPQLIKTVKSKDVSGLSLLFIVWWLLGEIFVLSYVLYKAFRWPLIFNYAFNILVCMVLIFYFYKLKPRRKNYKYT
jgi:uncharacterized protein with PQ loop repeat